MRQRWLGFALVAFAAAPAVAQSVLLHGTVRDSASGLPLAGSVVQVLAADSAIGRTLSGTAGFYELRIDRAAAPRTLEIRHVGYTPRRVPLSSISSDGAFDVGLLRLPVELEAVHVRGNEACPVDNEGRAFALWDRARTGLLAAVIARETHPAQTRVIRYDRSLDVGTSQIVQQSVELGESNTGRPFFAVVDAGRFGTQGYVHEDSTGRTFFGPDADVLLDTRFVATHCLSIAPRDSAHPGEIGLGFAPSPSTSRDTLSEVRGVLWMDASSHELKTLEFRFTKLEPAAIEARAGGLVGFRTMANGLVMIDHWFLHLPMVTTQVLAGPLGKPVSLYYKPQPFAQRVRDGKATIAGLHEIGGIVSYAEWPDGTKYNSGLATIRGAAHYATTQLPAPHIMIMLDGTPYTTFTDDRGAFEMSGVLPGVYSVIATDSLDRRLGLRRSRRVQGDAAFSGSRRVLLDVEPDDEAVDDQCGPIRIGFETIIRGRVLHPSGAPAASTHLNIAWDPSLDDAGPNSADVVANEQGEFAVCNVPRDRAAHVRALADHGEHLEARLSLAGDSPVQLVTLRLNPP